MPNVNDLYSNLMAELEALNGKEPTDADLARIGAKCQVADRIIDTMRVEVQLAAVMKGAMEVPFIESQSQERPNTPPALPEGSAGASAEVVTLTPTERMDKMLHSGPAANHPWRGLGNRAAS